MKKFIKKNPVLLVVDVQKGFLDEKYWGGNRNNKNAELICSKLINKWRDLNLKIIHVKHSSLNPKSPLHKNNSGFEKGPISIYILKKFYGFPLEKKYFLSFHS